MWTQRGGSILKRVVYWKKLNCGNPFDTMQCHLGATKGRATEWNEHWNKMQGIQDTSRALALVVGHWTHCLVLRDLAALKWEGTNHHHNDAMIRIQDCCLRVLMFYRATLARTLTKQLAKRQYNSCNLLLTHLHRSPAPLCNLSEQGTTWRPVIEESILQTGDTEIKSKEQLTERLQGSSRQHLDWKAGVTSTTFLLRHAGHPFFVLCRNLMGGIQNARF